MLMSVLFSVMINRRKVTLQAPRMLDCLLLLELSQEDASVAKKVKCEVSVKVFEVVLMRTLVWAEENEYLEILTVRLSQQLKSPFHVMYLMILVSSSLCNIVYPFLKVKETEFLLLCAI